MNVLKTLEMKDTDKSLLLQGNNSIFNDLFELMVNKKLDRLFFLSSLGNLYKLEGIDLDDLIFKSLIETKLEYLKAEKVQRTISQNIAKKISERRAVSFRTGNFGLINPFDESKMEFENVKPSINHIYGSYFFNTFALFESMKKIYSSMTYSTIVNMFDRFAGKVGEFIEELYICEECGSFSIEKKLLCKHERPISLKLLKINTEIMYAWEKGILFTGYLGYVLNINGWKTYIEKEVIGNCTHQIDVIAEKNHTIAIFECKNYEQGRKINKNNLMQSLGVMDDIERFIKSKSVNINVVKVYATTSDYHRDIKNINSRGDVILLRSKEIFAPPEKWVSKIE